MLNGKNNEGSLSYNRVALRNNTAQEILRPAPIEAPQSHYTILRVSN